VTITVTDIARARKAMTSVAKAAQSLGYRLSLIPVSKLTARKTKKRMNS